MSPKDKTTFYERLCKIIIGFLFLRVKQLLFYVYIYNIMCKETINKNAPA